MTTCCACNEQLTAATYVLDNQQTMCPTCVDSDDLHHRLWPDCNAAWHQPLDHLTDIQFNGSSAL